LLGTLAAIGVKLVVFEKPDRRACDLIGDLHNRKFELISG
jgi:hypothetical protein